MSLKRLLVLVFLISSCAHVHKPEESSFQFFSRQPAAQESAITHKTLWTVELNQEAQFDQLAQPSTGVIRQGQTIKLFIDNRVAKAPVVYFMNANYCPAGAGQCAEPPAEAVFHYHFAKKVLKNFSLSETDYVQNAYYTTTVDERKYFDARVQRFSMKVNGQEEVFYGLRFIERDLINNEMIKHAAMAVLQKMKIPNQKLAVILNSQNQDVTAIKPWLESQQISIFTMEQILSGVSFVGLNPGVAYGVLKVFPPNEEDLEPYDIPMFSSLPLDLAVVAGTLSTEYQDVGSHINLKSKERGTPNMVIRDQAKIEELKTMHDQPIKLTVNYEGYKVESTTKEKVFEEYRKKINKPGQKVTQINETKLVRFDEMCIKAKPSACLEKSKSYGGKVAGLGFLAHPTTAGVGSALQKKFKYRLNPMGFGIPLTYYTKFMEHNSNRDPKLKELLNKLVNAEMGLNNEQPLQTGERKNLVVEIKEHILKGEIPDALYKNVYAEMQHLKQDVAVAYPGTVLDKLKIRSSSNAEDIEGFNGAGLHDSYSARIEKSAETDGAFTDCKFVMGVDEDTELSEEDVEPKSLACAIKATYASLWNLRAVRERTYKRFDHRTASMGLSVQPSYKFRKGIKISSNSVMVTRVLGTESVYGQQLSSQVKNGLVTNPVPNTKSELVVISFDNEGKNFGINVLQYAKPKVTEPVLTQTIMTKEKMLELSEIARAIEIVYCQSKPNYFPGGDCKKVTNSQKKNLSLDMEFKQYDNNEVLIKQVRTFSGK